MKRSGQIDTMVFALPVLAVLLLPAAGAAQAAADLLDGVYRGALGTQAVVLEIGRVAENHRTDDAAGDEDAEKYPIEGRYFYSRHGVGILLKGRPQADGSVVLKEYQAMKATGGQWRVTFRGAEASGVFCKCDLSQAGSQGSDLLKISLTRVSEGFDPEFSWDEGKKAKDQAYYDLLLEFPVKTGAEISAGAGIAHVMRTDPRFPVSLPKLTRFPEKTVMERVNGDLEQEFRNRRLRAADCLFQGQLFTGGSWEERTKVALVNREVLSVVREAGWFCGGAYPDGGSDPLIYNLRTGAELELGDIFSVRGSEPQPRARYGEIAHDPAYAALFDLYLRHYKKPAAECGTLSYDRDRLTLVFYFTDKGLALEPELPHASRGCGPPIVIPYRELQGVLRKDGLVRNQNPTTDEH